MSAPREYRPFVPACRQVGLGRTRAYELAGAGLLESFLIGRRRFIYLDSLYSLPQRLAESVEDKESGR